ncbi:hypothetical protein Ahu01nite_073170 [Winogradskya humida]|uniref:4-amino-4-deoxy-L-arabinose transferase-like glycosyltransferase n=1 Tax=Winogradskya humida TaxID=113566 RepID=A0ABQ4A020_9ACTN|nr:hypothetical protein Ahu01nite_073170 [Actinoplanes humidus]
MRAMTAVGVVSLVAAVAFLVAPPMGIDLAAQVAHADFWGRHGGALLDFGWYGGTSPYGYSLLTPAPMAWLGGGTGGAKALGAIAAVVASLLLTLLLLRTGARRPLAAGLLGALGVFGNIVSGRVTFTVGLVFGLSALLALTFPQSWRRAAAVAAAVLAGAASPVAGLFVGLAGTALLLSAGLRRTERPGTAGRRLDGFLIAVAAAVPTIGMSLLFGTSGPMNTINSDTLRSFTVSLLVALLVPRRAVRIGALFSAAGVLAASILTTPVGLNAGRLSATFALVTLAGYAALPSRVRLPEALSRPAARVAAMAVLLAGVALWQHPVAAGDLRGTGDPMASPEYFRPLLDEVERRQPVGRVEVVPTANYWEAAYVPGTAPLARGWLRQADTDRNPLFFEKKLTAAGYGTWLRDSGVSLVALAAAPPASVARREARLVRSKPSYLKQVWRNKDWTLYEVSGDPELVTGAELVSSTDGAVVFDAASPGDVLVRVRWSRWLSLRGPGGCVEAGPAEWTTARVRTPGRYVLSGSLSSGPSC